MPYNIYKCKVCDKNVQEVSSFKISGNEIKKLSCGHSEIVKIIIEKGDDFYENLMSVDKRKLFPFQVTGARAAEKSNLNFLFADEMGLGKTVQILASLKAQSQDTLPCAIICPATIKTQWSIEIARWFGPLTLRIQIENSRDAIPSGAQFYIFSFDILRRFVKKVKERNLHGELIETEDWTKLRELFTKLVIKTIVIDECQLIKNHKSTRSKALTEVAKLVKYKLAASGTPIENNASEFFPILNILKPELFPTNQGFIDSWCQSYWTGYSYKIGGIKNIEHWKKFTQDFIIRRKRIDVELDFPEINRQYHYYDLGEEVQKAYDETVEELDDYISENGMSGFAQSQCILEYLNRMRHLTGLSKVNDTVSFVDDFINSTDRKLVLFVHHVDVGNLLEAKINKLFENLSEMFGKKYSKVYRIFGGQAAKAFQTGEDFQDDLNARVMIVPTLAGGVGLNLQRKIGDCVAVEREWNSSKEEQGFSGRFTRIGSKYKSTNISYMLAVGTVDEDFTRIVERKRAILAKFSRR